MTSARAIVLGALILTATSGCFGGGRSDWAYQMAGVDALYDQGYDGHGILVAIVDTGIDADHPSLDHIPIAAWADFVNGADQPYDDVGHGTHVASIVAGEGADFDGEFSGFDLRGASPKVTLLVVKAINADGTGQTSDVVDGVDFAVEHDADVLCLSLGARDQPLNLLSNPMQDAVNRALNAGILVVASAGNEDTRDESSDVDVPANVEGVIAVGALARNGSVADFSMDGSAQANQGIVGGVGARPNPHKKPEIVAPGVDIKGAWKDGSYATASGTSQAAPFVCGGLALLLDKYPDLRERNSRSLVNDVKTRLMQTAEPVSGQTTPHDNHAGYGLFKADALAEAFAAR